MKRILSAVLFLLMIVGVFPLGIFATSEGATTEPTTSVDTSDVEIGGGGLGTMISNAVEDEEAIEEEDANIENKILEVTMEEDMALVEFNNNVECKIIVGLYDENTGAMLCSGIEENIEPHMGGIYIAIDTETMPEFYIVRAFLLDMNNVALHKSYENIHYTTEFQEFLAKTTDDFAEEDVLNFDSNEENNFAVFAEGTITITQSEYNILESADEENFVYTFSNVNNKITSLKNGDAVYFENDETFVIFKVDTVTVDGATATITGQEDIALDEFFSYVKIDSTIPEEDEVATYGIGERGIQVGDSVGTKIDINFEYKGVDDENIEGIISLNGYAKFTAELKLYISSELFEIYVGIEEEENIDIITKGTIKSKEIELPKIVIPLFWGVDIQLEPVIVFEASMEFSGNYTKTAKTAFEYNSYVNKIIDKSSPSKTDFSVDVEGRVYIGLKINPSAKLLKVVYFGFSAEVGVEVIAKGKLLPINEFGKHNCGTCVSGEVNGIFEISIVLGIKITDKLSEEFKYTFPSPKLHIFNFYYSDISGWGTGECPNVNYKVDLLVIDGNGNPVPGVSANGVVTNEKGIAEFGYLGKGRYTLTLKKDTFDRNYTIDVDRAGMKTVVVDLTNYTDEAYFKYTINNGNATITGFDKTYEGEVIIPKTLSGYPVTKIGGALSWPFWDNKKITKVVIPNTVKEIADNAFWGCSSLKSVIIPNGLISIGNDAFYDCSKLKYVELPDSVTSIGYRAFDCSNLTDINISENNPVYKSIDGVVYNKDGNMLCIYPRGKNLTSFAIPNNVTSVDDYAFYGCEKLKEIIIPNSVTTIGEASFTGCRKIEEIFIPGNVKSIGKGSFAGCLNLININVSEDNSFYKSIDGVFFNKDVTVLLCYPEGKEWANYTTPSTVVEIFESSFSSCPNIVNLHITKGVELIGKKAFSHCSNLKSIIIPNSVKKIDWDAYFYSNNLTDIYYGGDEKSWTEINIFSYGNLIGTTIHYNSTPDSIESIAYTPNAYILSTSYTTKDAITKTDLVPGEIYTLMLLRSRGDLTTDNLIYITDMVADETGTAEFSYVYETSSDEFIIIVTGPCNHDVSDWITVYEPTSSDVGVRVKLCSKCDTVIGQKEIPMLTVSAGDVTGDDKVNLADVSLILKYIAKWEVELDADVADVTGDGKVNLADVSLILKYIAKWDVVLGK